MRVAFGDCEFDSGRRVLLRHGSIRPLSLKAFQLLEVLLDRRPEAISKTELIEQLWPGTFVSDASLHNLVAEVRAALGDAPRLSRYIRTVPKYGYAFYGDARRLTTSSQSRMRGSGLRLTSGSEEWLLSEGPNLVGRDPECAIRIDSATLSRRHAQIVVADRHATVEDLGSKNGTQVNEQPVSQPVALKDGDEIQFGSVTLTYRTVRDLPSTVTRRS
jgi:DNA-binding winged helix-turn-helix (wHTH) protein